MSILIDINRNSHRCWATVGPRGLFSRLSTCLAPDLLPCILNSSDDGVKWSILVYPPLPIVWYSKEYSVPETELVVVLRWKGGRHLLCWKPLEWAVLRFWRSTRFEHPWIWKSVFSNAVCVCATLAAERLDAVYLFLVFKSLFIKSRCPVNINSLSPKMGALSMPQTRTRHQRLR
jgi:hypothetical protein